MHNEKLMRFTHKVCQSGRSKESYKRRERNQCGIHHVYNTVRHSLCLRQAPYNGCGTFLDDNIHHIYARGQLMFPNKSRIWSETRIPQCSDTHFLPILLKINQYEVSGRALLQINKETWKSFYKKFGRNKKRLHRIVPAGNCKPACINDCMRSSNSFIEDCCFIGR